MSCPYCGENCRCLVESRLASHVADNELLDPEAPDHCEEQFAASLESDYVVDSSGAYPGEDDALSQAETAAVAVMEAAPETEALVPASTAIAPPSPGPEAWKTEVAARMENYRARKKPRPPKYPSLMLKFDELECAPSAPLTPTPAPLGEISQSLALSAAPLPVAGTCPSTEEPGPAGKIIEFPRSSSMFPVPIEELADPVFEQPRILEAPEVVPPPPALGGITIEAEPPEADLKRPGIDVPLASSSVERRMLAAAIDGFIVSIALAAYGGIFFRLAAPRLSLLQLAAGGSATFAVWWSAYQYLLMVHAGNTVGARLAKLKLLRFDGRPADQKQRRKRVLAAMLSAASLGMGYAWYFLDEDGLCWHYRITQTHLGPRLAKHAATE
jgi:uncharacterized RDD family membrane protein YckC